MYGGALYGGGFKNPAVGLSSLQLPFVSLLLLKRSRSRRVVSWGVLYLFKSQLGLAKGRQNSMALLIFNFLIFFSNLSPINGQRITCHCLEKVKNINKKYLKESR